MTYLVSKGIIVTVMDIAQSLGAGGQLVSVVCPSSTIVIFLNKINMQVNVEHAHYVGLQYDTPVPNMIV